MGRSTWMPHIVFGACWARWRLTFGVFCDKKVPLNLKLSFIEWWLDQMCCMRWSITDQELICLEDENCKDKNVAVDVWAILEGIRLGMNISETKCLVRKCKRLEMVGIKRGRGGSKKY
ncbi:hypothetical protein H5410_062474 [Solanum commersonii]|uniref:Uncharacterized protein n=1 Tax=Solanum commersonii TaxID=4109 RepID=A0A9J5WBM9_SOLCO|nr:hypothetical protein H5410_062474 [Solanum commersonii]